MDGDIIPLCNMDYIFHESYRPDGFLSDYVSVSGSAAPTTASSFLVTPKKGLFDKVLDIVRNRPNKTEFDMEIGWGHKMDTDDTWESWWWKRRIWDFKAAASDQGILLMFFKYTLLNFTQINPGVVETWREVSGKSSSQQNNSQAHVVSAPNGKFISRVDVKQVAAHDGCKSIVVPAEKGNSFFFRDYVHFAGGSKPWAPAIESGMTSAKLWKSNTPRKTLWMHYLGKANEAVTPFTCNS